MHRAALLVLVLLVTGCGEEDQVRRYRVPKDPSWRMLAAMTMQGRETWFFKVVGPSEYVSAHKKDFQDFLKGVKFGDEGPEWKVPGGWVEEKGGGSRFATLRFGDKKPLLELSVITLAGDAGGLAANLQRWRRQMGLDAMPTSEEDKGTEWVGVGGTKGVLFDIEGPLRPTSGPMGRGGMASAPPPRREEPASGDQLDAVRALFKYEAPPEWKENSRPEGRRIYEFTAEGGGEKALITFTIFPGEMGGLASNINRWRRQAGLGELGDAAARDLATPMPFVGRPGHSVALVGPERAILGVFHLDEQFSMFLKMDGPPGIVVSNREKFLTFASTLSMGEHGE